jgi:hypothetical protein
MSFICLVGADTEPGVDALICVYFSAGAKLELIRC